MLSKNSLREISLDMTEYLSEVKCLYEMCKHHSGFTYRSITEMNKSSRLASSCRHGYLVALEKLFLLSLRRQREGQALNDKQKTIPMRATSQLSKRSKTKDLTAGTRQEKFKFEKKTTYKGERGLLRVATNRKIP